MNTADLRRRAEEEAQRLADEGYVLHPVSPVGKNMASHFWGKAWMKHLAFSETYGMRLAPGRKLVRAGGVVDLQVERGVITALVSAEALYTVSIGIRPLDEEEKECLRDRCVGHVASWVDLLEGRLGEELLGLLCDPEQGIFPNVSDWRMSCPCEDYADPCCHEAAALYAVGVLLDESPELLFTLRGVDAGCFIPDARGVGGDGGADGLKGRDLSSLFGIDLQGDSH